MAAAKSTIIAGLISIPVRLEKATDDESGNTHTVCTGSTDAPHDPARVKMAVRCSHCDTERSSVFAFPQRGHEVDGKLVVLTAEEIAGAAGDPIKSLTLAFHPREKVYGATVAGDSVQNVSPDKGGERAYVALRNALLANPDVVACAIWAPKSKNALWVLEVVGERIVASKRAWPETVRAVAAPPQAEVSELEQSMFDTMVGGLVSDFDVAAYVDERKAGVRNLIAERMGQAVTAAGDTTVTAAPAGDLLAALQASLDSLPKQTKPRAAKKATPAKRATPAKKAAAKKPAAKRTTTRKKVA